MTRENLGQHEVRFLPNVNDPANSLIRRELYWSDGGFVSKQQFCNNKKAGIDGTRLERYLSYANVDGVDGLFYFGRSVHNAVKALLDGEYYSDADGAVITADRYHEMPNLVWNDNKADQVKKETLYRHNKFARNINAFDLQGNVSVKFTTELTDKFIRYTDFEFVFDQKNVAWEIGTEKDAVVKRLSALEPVPADDVVIAQMASRTRTTATCCPSTTENSYPIW